MDTVERTLSVYLLTALLCAGCASTPSAPTDTDEDANAEEQKQWMDEHGDNWMRDICTLPPEQRDPQLALAKARNVLVSCGDPQALGDIPSINP
jgi:hypothetical protein